MIHGRVHRLQACVGVIIRLPNQPDLEIECIVDTGFEGALTLPKEAVTALGLPYFTELKANLADNSNVQTDVHTAVIIWNEQEVEVAVLAMGNRPLIGVALLEGKEFAAQFVENGMVTIDDL